MSQETAQAEASQKEASQRPEPAHERAADNAARLGLRDVLRIDVPRIHGAITSRGVDASAPAKLLLGILEEHRPRYETRVLYCPPLPLLWSFAGDDSPAAIIHQA